ncbi:MAG: HAD family phosphatase [Bacteroidota bacterium]
MSIRAILFDFDGTTVDSEKVNYLCWRDCMHQQGIELTEEDYLLNYIGHPTRDSIERAIAQHGLNVSVADMQELGRLWYAERPEAQQFHLMPGVMKSLNFYKRRGLRLAIVTGSHRPVIDRFFQQFQQMQDYFEFAVTASDVEKSKPDPASYQLALQQLGLPAEAVIAFEDTLSGTRSAKGANIRCYAIQRAAILCNQLNVADHVFKDLETARKYLLAQQLV